MAGLSVLLETDESSCIRPQIVSKATLHSPKIPSSSPWSPAGTPAASTTGSFLQRCFRLCFKDLAENNDIYMYRGDEAFCSVETRTPAAAASAPTAPPRAGGVVSFAY